MGVAGLLGGAMRHHVIVIGDEHRLRDDLLPERKRVAITQPSDPKPNVHAQTQEAARRVRQMARKALKDEGKSAP